jgi:hypothetical protein
MVYDLVGKQHAADMALHHQSMLHHQAAIDLDPPVAPGSYVASWPPQSEALPVLFDPRAMAASRCTPSDPYSAVNTGRRHG